MPVSATLAAAIAAKELADAREREHIKRLVLKVRTLPGQEPHTGSRAFARLVDWHVLEHSDHAGIHNPSRCPTMCVVHCLQQGIGERV